VVIFLHKLEEGNVNQELAKSVKLIVAKNRDGASGYFALKYQGNTTTFTEGLNENEK